MIYIVLGVCIIFLILGFICLESRSSYDVGTLFICVSTIIGVPFVIALFIALGCYNSTKSTADSQIKVYEEQNDIIITQIEPLVEKYLNYEKEAYSALKVNPNTLIAMSMKPELKGNEFVQSQIKIIIENQKKITDLKLDRAKLNAYKLWIFMGE